MSSARSHSGPYVLSASAACAAAIVSSTCFSVRAAGTIYAPMAALTRSGNSQSGTSQQPLLSFVVDTMTLSGNATA
jgi:hypothetical protein